MGLWRFARAQAGSGELHRQRTGEEMLCDPVNAFCGMPPRSTGREDNDGRSRSGQATAPHGRFGCSQLAGSTHPSKRPLPISAELLFVPETGLTESLVPGTFPGAAHNRDHLGYGLTTRSSSNR